MWPEELLVCTSVRVPERDTEQKRQAVNSYRYSYTAKPKGWVSFEVG